jgi:hypothetical protein
MPPNVAAAIEVTDTATNVPVAIDVATAFAVS